MLSNNSTPVRLLARASAARCKDCPPDRVCAWACIQGAGMEDIVIGAVLQESGSWAFAESDPAQDLAREALAESYNAG